MSKSMASILAALFAIIVATFFCSFITVTLISISDFFTYGEWKAVTSFSGIWILIILSVASHSETRENILEAVK